MVINCDLLIVGSGFVGSIMGMVATRLGLSVVIVDKARHPRFAIGESSTPMANLLLERLSVDYDLPELLGFTEWGRWQKAYPQIPVGLKRGFTFLAHEEGRVCGPDRGKQLLVAASPRDALADTHWFRAAFDAKLAELAHARGARVFTGAQILSASVDPQVRMRVRCDEAEHDIQARFLFDASGPRGFLHRLLGMRDQPVQEMPMVSALFSHFENVAALPAEVFSGAPPYPPEDAAVHHLFPGGWIWALRFNNGIVSAGVSATAPLARDLALEAGEAAWHSLIARFPTLRGQFAGAKAVQPFFHQPSVSYRASRITGRNWAMAPSAAAFIDPLLSTGFTLSLLGVRRMASMFARQFPPTEANLGDYAMQCAQDSESAGKLVAALFGSLGRFEDFRSLSLLYFAASIIAEARSRAGDAGWLSAFQTRREPFGEGISGICRESLAGQLTGNALLRRVEALIQPHDPAGLCDPSREHWFPFV